MYLTPGFGGSVMNDVRKKGSGTWDRSQDRWELKKLGIRKTPQQLAAAARRRAKNVKLYGVAKRKEWWED